MSDLRRAAVEQVNRGEAFPLGEWFDAVLVSATRLQQLSAQDNAIRRTVALAPLISAGDPPQPSSMREHLLLAEGPAAIREALGILSHATALDHATSQGRLMAQVEKELLAKEAIAPVLDTALGHLAATLTRHPINASTATQVAWLQQRLLTYSRTLLSEVEDADGHQSTRVEAALTRSLEQWGALTATQPHHVPGQQPASTPRRDLILAQHELQVALRQEKDPVTQLAALVRTNFGGNLAAAQALHTVRPNTALLAASHSLIDASDHLDSQSLRRLPTPPPTAESALPEGIKVTGTHQVPEPPSAPRQHQTGLVDPDLRLTKEIEVDLAQRRDVGLLADAALNGDPDARAVITRHNITAPELQQLKLNGEAAVAQLVVSVTPAIRQAHSYARGRPDFEDTVQAATVRMLKAARTWDPNHESGSRWLTMATHVADYSRAEAVRLATAKRIATTSLDNSTVTVPQRAETQIGPEDETVSKLQVQRLLDVVDKLSAEDPPVGSAISAHLGLDGRPPATLMDVAEQLHTSQSTARLLVHKGLIALVEEIQPAPTLEDISSLPADTQKLLTSRYGLDGAQPQAFDELASTMGWTTRQTVDRLLHEVKSLSSPRDIGTPMTGRARIPLPTTEDLAVLPPHLAVVVTTRLGLEDGTPMSFGAVGEAIGSSQATAWQQFHQAMFYLEQRNPRFIQTKSASIDDIQTTLDRLARSDAESEAPPSTSAHHAQPVRRPDLGRDLG